MANQNGKLPALRPVEVMQTGGPDDVQYVVLDRQRISDAVVKVAPLGCFVLGHLDGQHSVEDIERRLLEQVRVRVPPGSILELVNALDQALLLRTERFENAYAERLAEYRAAGVRDNRGQYPPREEFESSLRSLLREGAVADGPIRGLVAPHLDYERGWPAYADAYATLAASECAERYVILGTNHFGRSSGAVATTNAFRTALGDVPIDRSYVESLESELGCSLRAFELDHQFEHSVELQVHLLQVTHEGRPFEIVPILCPYPCGPTGTAPADGDGPDLARLADAIGKRLASDPRPTILIAGADLSHVGTNFGDSAPMTPERLGEIARADTELLTHLERGEVERFLAAIRASDNSTQVCSPGCLYVIRRALRDRRYETLRYHQAVNFETDTHVTCTAAVLR